MPPLLIPIVLTLSLTALASAADPQLTVCTFNIRNSGANDGKNAWPERRAAFVAAVRRIDPDVIGFQEVLADQQDDLTHDLSDHDSVAVHRDDGHRAGEAASLFWKRDRFARVDSGTFWLSPDENHPGPPAWDAACTRICTWAVLHDKVAGRDIAVFNTHFDHVGDVARAESAKLIAKHLATTKLPAVLVGDFNAVETGPVYAELLSATRAAGRPLVDAYREVHPTTRPDEASFHGFTDTTQGLRIDWVFHDAAFTTLQSTIDRRTDKDGHYPSDHWPVWAVLTYAANSR